MAGASRTHNLITLNLASELQVRLQGRACETYASDMRVKVAPTGLYTYPDVIVVCGERRFEDEHEDTLLSPQVIIEVLSPSTEAYDRGKKFEHYRQIPSLREYLLTKKRDVILGQFCRKLLGYALGRGVLLSDKPLLAEMLLD